MMEEGTKIIVIGASAGGFQTIPQLISQLPPNINAAVFIVLHLSKKAIGEVLVNHLQRNSRLPCKFPNHGEKIKKGTVYIAPPDQHMLLKEDSILITNGPAENLWRPSIDVLFRSAAAAYSSRVIGIILSGMLDDGTSGMSAIKRSGGKCIIQNPNEAEFPDMPLSVLNNIEVNHSAHLSDMGYIIMDMLSEKDNDNPIIPAPEDVQKEAKIAERIAIGIDKIEGIGKQTSFTCPSCGGNLFEIDTDNIQRFRCYTGHAFTEQSLLQKQSQALEEALWFSIRMMEERKNMLETITKNNRKKGLTKSAESQEAQAEALKNHIERLKETLLEVIKN